MPLSAYDAFDGLDCTRESVRRIIVKLCEPIVGDTVRMK